MAEVGLTPTEQVLVRTLVSAIVRELRQENERPARLILAAGRDVRGNEGREHHEDYINL